MATPFTEQDYRRFHAAVAPADAADAAVLERCYRVGSATHKTAPTPYDDRLAARVPATVQAEILAYTLGYFLVFGHKLRLSSLKVVSERMIRAWEVATGKTAGPYPRP